jgi:hypothetical protein
MLCSATCAKGLAHWKFEFNLKTATGTSHVVNHWIHLGEGFF